MSTPSKTPPAARSSKKASAKKKRPGTRGRRAKTHAPDWQAIEAVYRTGQYTLSALSQRFDVGASTISEYATRHGWDQRISAEVRARAAVKAANTRRMETKEPASEAQIADAVEVAADLQARVLCTHRALLERVRGTGEAMMADVARIMEGIDDAVVEEIVSRQALVDDQAGRKLRKGERTVFPLTAGEVLQYRMALLERAAEIYRKTSAPIARLIELERQAYSMDDMAGPPTTLGRLLDEIQDLTSNNPIARLREQL